MMMNVAAGRLSEAGAQKMAITGSGDEAIYFEDHGTGFPVLLIPGLGGVCSCFAAQVPVFAREYRVIIHDHRGTGRGARPLMTYSVEQMTEDALRVMDACGIERAHVVGHSTGGAIGQIMAIEHPERIAAFVGSNTWTHADAYFKHVFRFRRSLLEHGMVAEYATAGSLLLWNAEWIAANSERVEREEKMMRDNFPDPRMVMARIDAISAFDRRADLSRIKAPTLIYGSNDDMVTPAYFSRDLAKRVAGAKLAMLPIGGHSSYQTAPDAWNVEVLNFLRQISARSFDSR
jgi:aminoacrylate hydrolase